MKFSHITSEFSISTAVCYSEYVTYNVLDLRLVFLRQLSIEKSYIKVGQSGFIPVLFSFFSYHSKLHWLGNGDGEFN